MALSVTYLTLLNSMQSLPFAVSWSSALLYVPAAVHSMLLSVHPSLVPFVWHSQDALSPFQLTAAQSWHLSVSFFPAFLEDVQHAQPLKLFSSPNTRTHLYHTSVSSHLHHVLS